MLPDPHGPNRLENYISVHESYMEGFLREGFVIEDSCVFTPYKHEVKLDGVISCKGNIYLEVAKNIAYLDGTGRRALVKTSGFRYHAWVKGVGNIIRYEFNYDHRGVAHKHTYDTFGTGEEVVEELKTTHEIPHLDAVIVELHAWYHKYRSRLE